MSNFYDTMVEKGYFVPKSENYFWVYDMEWLAKDKIESKRTDENITPFAVTAGGDVWGFFEDKIVFCGYDGECTYYADSLENAVFRAVLQYLSDFGFDPVNPDDEDEETEAFARKYINDVINVFGEVFSEDMISELKRISLLPLKEQGYGLNFISPEEADSIIKKYIGFELMDTNVFAEDNSELPLVKPSDMSGYVFFTDEEMYNYAYKCAELADIHSVSYEKYLSDAKSADVKETLLYKGGNKDIFIYRIADALFSGSLEHGTKKKNEAECKGTCCKYYLGADGKPIYSEEFLSGMDKQPSYIKFYLYEENKLSAVSFIIYPLFKYYRTEVNEFSEDGKLLSYTWFDDNSIEVYERYDYSDKILESCTELQWYYYNKHQDMLRFYLHKYNYSDGKMVTVDRYMQRYDHSAPDILQTEEIKEKIFKYFVKNKLIG